MNLRFTEHLTAKTCMSVHLKVYPEGEPGDFLILREEVERGEGTASTCEYAFPDDTVVVARWEFGPAVIDPDAPGDVTIEVHIGPGASASLAAAAESEAREMAAEAGIEEYRQDTTGFPDFSGFSIIRHGELRRREELEQKIIDPATGRDITGEALSESRQEYELELEEIIEEATDKIARGIPRIKAWEEAESRIKALQQKLWDAHKGGWLQDWLQTGAGEDRFARDLKRARRQLGID